MTVDQFQLFQALQRLIKKETKRIECARIEKVYYQTINSIEIFTFTIFDKV